MNNINGQNFVEDLLEEYITKSFGTLSKRDLEVLLFHLLIKHGHFGKQINYFEISKTLRISESRVRNLYQDVQLRYNLYSDEEAREHFIQIIEKNKFDKDSQDRYRFQIRDPLLRQYIEEWVESVNGIMDSSFSPTLVIISRDVFIDILQKFSPHKTLSDLRNSLPDGVDQEVIDEQTMRGILGRFIDQHIDTLADESAKSMFTLAGVALRALFGLFVA